MMPLQTAHAKFNNFSNYHNLSCWIRQYMKKSPKNTPFLQLCYSLCCSRDQFLKHFKTFQVLFLLYKSKNAMSIQLAMVSHQAEEIYVSWCAPYISALVQNRMTDNIKVPQSKKLPGLFLFSHSTVGARKLFSRNSPQTYCTFAISYVH